MALSPIKIDEGAQRDVISCPQVSWANAALQIPTFARTDALARHGGSTFRKRRTRELVRVKRGPAKYVAESGEMKFPWGETAHLS